MLNNSVLILYVRSIAREFVYGFIASSCDERNLLTPTGISLIELLSIQIIFSVVLTSLETITPPADRCQETILIRLEKVLQLFVHERQRIFFIAILFRCR